MSARNQSSSRSTRTKHSKPSQQWGAAATVVEAAAAEATGDVEPWMNNSSTGSNATPLLTEAVASIAGSPQIVTPNQVLLGMPRNK